jgi:uncharacterized lipoprotein YajG
MKKLALTLVLGVATLLVTSCGNSNTSLEVTDSTSVDSVSTDSLTIDSALVDTTVVDSVR